MFGRQRQQRPLSSFVLRALVPRAVLFGAVAAALLIGRAMAVDPLAAPADTTMTSVPGWTAADAAAYSGCVPADSWPQGRVAPAVVVHSFRNAGDVRMAFDEAWRVNHNGTETDDVWVVGVCP